MHTPANTAQILNSYRKSDAVIIVCQDNDKKTIVITAINNEASRLLGHTNGDLVGKKLSAILPERISSTVEEFVEFEENQNDLAFVLGKIRSFAIKTKSGHDLPFKLRIVHGEPIDKNPYFHLVLTDDEAHRKRNAFRAVLVENFKGHEVIDARTGLPDRASLIKDLEMIIYYVRSKEISASFAIIDINDYDVIQEKYDVETCHRLHEHIGRICKQKIRAEDTLGSLSERTLGIVLIDVEQEPAHLVLNRLRWTIGVSPLLVTDKKEITAQVNIVYMQIDGKISDTEVLNYCEATIKDMRHSITNSIQLAVKKE